MLSEPWFDILEIALLVTCLFCLAISRGEIHRLRKKLSRRTNYEPKSKSKWDDRVLVAFEGGFIDKNGDKKRKMTGVYWTLKSTGERGFTIVGIDFTRENAENISHFEKAFPWVMAGTLDDVELVADLDKTGAGLDHKGTALQAYKDGHRCVLLTQRDYENLVFPLDTPEPETQKSKRLTNKDTK